MICVVFFLMTTISFNCMYVFILVLELLCFFWLKYVWSIFGAILIFHASIYSLADSAFTGS